MGTRASRPRRGSLYDCCPESGVVLAGSAMTGLRHSSSCSHQLLVRPALFFLVASSAFATGYFGPSVYLDEGGRRVTGSPEFYWGMEVKRLARDFHPTERLVQAPRKLDEEGAVDRAPLAESTA